MTAHRARHTHTPRADRSTGCVCDDFSSLQHCRHVFRVRSTSFLCRKKSIFYHPTRSARSRKAFVFSRPCSVAVMHSEGLGGGSRRTREIAAAHTSTSTVCPSRGVGNSSHRVQHTSKHANEPSSAHRLALVGDKTPPPPIIIIHSHHSYLWANASGRKMTKAYKNKFVRKRVVKECRDV